MSRALNIDVEPNEFETEYLIGADGAWSAVRRSMGIEFEGYTYPERFLVISTDFEFADHLPRLSYVNYCSDPEEWCVLLRVPTLWRVLFPTQAGESDEECLSDTSVERRLQKLLPQPHNYSPGPGTLYQGSPSVGTHLLSWRLLPA